MDISAFVTQARDAVTVKRVFGEPYEKDGVTVIPAAAVWGAGGGGGGHDERGGDGEGGGFGLTGRPAGAYVIRDGDVTWLPAIDVNRLVVSTGMLSAFSLLMIGRIVKARAKSKGKRR